MFRFVPFRFVLYRDPRYISNITSVEQNKYSRQRNFFPRFRYLRLLEVTFILAFTTNAMTSDFLSSIFPGWVAWVVISLNYHRTVFAFRSWSDWAGVVRAFRISIVKIFKSLQYYLHRVTDITSFEKHLESSLGHNLRICPNWWNIVSRICFWRNLSLGFLRWSSLQNKEGRISSRWARKSKVWPRDHREDYRSFTGPSTDLYRSFLEHCTLD